ncbi:MAG: response regulator transcription factor [Actinomycetota bacterium]|nr:response regulator transcription factor [Actinomycetota bacterium]
MICDDHRVLGEALAQIVQGDPTLELISPPLTDPQEAVALCLRERPDVVLMDVEFGGTMTGIDATRLIKRGSPETNVVVITGHQGGEYVVDAVEAGASGFLTKMQAMEDLIGAVKAAARGESVIDPALLTRVLRDVAKDREIRRDAEVLLGQLTERESEILKLLAEGLRNDDIAERLVISPQTVQTHVRNILSKLRVHSRLEAVAFAVRHGWLTV